MNALPFNKKVRVVSALVEGCSLRATERLTDVARNTVYGVALDTGESCRRLHNALMRDVQVAVLELDEIWAFIGKKQKRLTDQDPPEMGDCYTFLAIAATQKAIVSYTVGKRDSLTTADFVTDLRPRVLGKPQISTDGFGLYMDAIRDAFGDDVDYAQIIKEYSVPDGDDRKYSPPKCTGADKRIMRGNPDPDKISTSYIERQNLTCRMQMRRFTRLTNAFSKRMRQHAAAVALYVCHYNFCRVHETLKTTPAVALDVTDHVWSVAELVDVAFQIAPEDAPRLPPPPAPGRPATTSAPALDAPQAPSGDDRQLSLLDWLPRSLRPVRPSADMEQIDLFPGLVTAPVESEG